MPKKIILSILISAFGFICFISSEVNAEESGLMLSPMPGYAVGKSTVVDFDEFQIYPVYCSGRLCKDLNILDKKFKVEGKIKTSEYNNNKTEQSAIAIVKNYENAIAAIGGELVNDPAGPNGARIFKISNDKGNKWVVLSNNYGYTYTITTIDSVSLKQSVTASGLSDSIKKDGFATLHIGFDTNKVTLKEDGQAAVKEIVTLLKSDQELKLSVEGHTDNVGDAKSNKTLSEQRAKAVMQAAVAQGVNASRLSSAGFGAEKPVADNRNEEGRAKNRRVELVKK
jgi:OmpA-OmpF porin, OOP family